jgi:uncharacterized protein YqgV (UPF0045/DUF77 family)
MSDEKYSITFTGKPMGTILISRFYQFLRTIHDLHPDWNIADQNALSTILEDKFEPSTDRDSLIKYVNQISHSLYKMELKFATTSRWDRILSLSIASL